MVSSTKKGWKALRDTVGDRPKPVSAEVQNALAFHSVMVSGMVTSRSAFPSELARDGEKRQRDDFYGILVTICTPFGLLNVSLCMMGHSMFVTVGPPHIFLQTHNHSLDKPNHG